MTETKTQGMDALVVGCGLSGAVIARYLADECDKKVVIWDRKNHIGGNMFDYIDEHGILVHKYGPHTFHTNNSNLFDYMCRFAEWQEYKLTCGAVINGIETPTPFNFKTIDDFYPPEKAAELKQHIKKEYGDREFVTVLEVLESGDSLIREYARFLFDHDYSLYTAKQWGVSAKEIDPSVLRRVPLRMSYNEGYFDDKIQVMPKKSYAVFFKKLLDHPNITVELNIEALAHLKIIEDGTGLSIDGKKVQIPVIYTGALDELFGCKYGRLPYRSLRFEWKYEEKDSKQGYPVVAYPEAKGYTRITEYKKLPVQKNLGTSYAVEFSLPYASGKVQEPYYPVLTEESQRLYSRYKDDANKIKNLYYCGRLADFKYYNMDQALERALEVIENIEA